MGGLGLMFRRRAIQAHPTITEGGYLFAEGKGDPEVFRILMSKGISSDGVGITKEDAEKVTSIASWFKANTAIEEFSELQYFKGVTTIASQAFYKCTALKSINLNNVITLNGQAFSGCVALQGDFNLPNLIGTLGSYCFSNTDIFSFKAENVEILAGQSFYDCPSLKTAEFLNLKEIKAQAFQNCTSLEKVNIGYASIIGNQAFYGCTSLKSCICLASTPPTIGNVNAFYNTSCNFYVPDESVDDYKVAEKWSNFSARIKGISEYHG